MEAIVRPNSLSSQKDSSKVGKSFQRQIECLGPYTRSSCFIRWSVLFSEHQKLQKFAQAFTSQPQKKTNSTKNVLLL